MGPALLPPDGVEPDFVNHVNGNTMVTAIVTVCLALSTFFLGIRAYAKGIYVKKLGIADSKYLPVILHASSNLSNFFLVIIIPAFV